MAIGSKAVTLPAALAGVRPASLAARRAALWALLVAKVLASWGVQWDIQWHTIIGRDSFWIAPHVMTYSGVTLMVLLSFGVLAWTTLRPSAAAGDVVRVLGLTSTRGFHLAAWGIALTVLAAPIDDLWHRLFGIDVTLWSPPHLLGLVGSAVNTAACLLIACEVYPGGGRVRDAAIVVNGAALLGTLAFAVQPTFRLAYLHGGIAFHSYAILAALLFPLAYVTAAKVSGLRAAPLLVLLVGFASGAVGTQIGRIGFAVLQPVSVIEEEIAKDPTSPIAVANAIARKNGDAPGQRSLVFQSLALIPVILMVVVDPRRRPVVAALVYGITLLATAGWSLARLPAYGPMAPDAGTTLIALVLTALAAVVAAVTARRLSAALGADR